MAKRMLKYIIASFALCTGGFLAAQTEQAGVGWRVYQAEGNITVAQNGTRAVYQGRGGEKGAETLEKITLKPGDLVQTSNGKAEMQIVAAGSNKETFTVIKLCENTSLLISDSQGKSGPVVELLYGRIRVITGTADSALTVRIGAASASVQNADIAIDFLAKKGVTQPILSLHCFNGKGDFVSRPNAAAPLALKPSETIVMESQSAMSIVEKNPTEAAVVAYWNETPFTDNAPLPSPASELASAQETKQEEKQIAAQNPEQQPEKQKKEKQSREPRPRRTFRPPTLKDGLAIAGILLAAAGTGMQVYYMAGYADPSLKNTLYYGSYIPLGAGVLLILGSSLFGSDKAASD
jgi:hypothetical protein